MYFTICDSEPGIPLASSKKNPALVIKAGFFIEGNSYRINNNSLYLGSGQRLLSTINSSLST